MASKDFNSINVLNNIMPTNPNRIAFNLPPEMKARLQIFMAKKGFNLRKQSEAITELLDRALKSEGY